MVGASASSGKMLPVGVRWILRAVAGSESLRKIGGGPRPSKLLAQGIPGMGEPPFQRLFLGGQPGQHLAFRRPGADPFREGLLQCLHRVALFGLNGLDTAPILITQGTLQLPIQLLDPRSTVGPVERRGHHTWMLNPATAVARSDFSRWTEALAGESAWGDDCVSISRQDPWMTSR